MSEEQISALSEEPGGMSSDPQPEPVTEKKGNAYLDAVKCMISFFTIIRLDVGQREFDAMESRFWLVPVLGFINGFVAFIVCSILGLCGIGLFGQAVAALGSMYVFSKFLHFDGLTDFGDGIIVSSGDREKHICALKDSLIGAGGFGVALMVVLFTVAMYYEIGCDADCGYISGDSVKIFGIGMAAFCIEVLVKNAQVAVASFGEPGNGMASRQVRCTTMDSLIRSTILTVVLLGIATLVGYAIGNAMDYQADIGTGWIAGMFAVSVIMSIAVGYLMARKANRTFGFVNGDILGATNEISRAVILLVTVMILGVM